MRRDVTSSVEQPRRRTLEYGNEPGFWTRVSEWGGPVAAEVSNIVCRIGGVRQLCFAFGLALALGGLGLAIDGRGPGSFLMSVGGFIIGLCIPLSIRSERGN